MTLFEYLAAGYTLILSFAVARVIGGLPDSLALSRRYWVHLVAIVALCLSMSAAFWDFWRFHAVEWTFARFLIALGPAVVLYFLAATLIPSSPDRVESWQEFYFSIRLRYFSAWIALALSVALATTILLDLPASHPYRAVQAVFLAVGALGLSSARPSVHAGIAIAALLALAAGALGLFAPPGLVVP